MYVACTRAQNGLVVTDYKFLYEFLKEGEADFKETMLFGEDD